MLSFKPKSNSDINSLLPCDCVKRFGGRQQMSHLFWY